MASPDTGTEPLYLEFDPNGDLHERARKFITKRQVLTNDASIEALVDRMRERINEHQDELQLEAEQFADFERETCIGCCACFGRPL